MNIQITKLILEAKEKAIEETASEQNPQPIRSIQWPIQCTVGPGLEGAIAAESKVGYVNGKKGWLIYRGYSIFDLCAHSNFEEVSYLLMHGRFPTAGEDTEYRAKLAEYRRINHSLRLLMSFSPEHISPMAALRLGINLMRQQQLPRDREGRVSTAAIPSDDDSIPMETTPLGHAEATYNFPIQQLPAKKPGTISGIDSESCYHIISGTAVITAAIYRLRQGKLPLEPRPELSHAGNLLYMMTGKEPTPLETRIMDVALILHADHGMNASTFASMVVASTLSDIYFSIGSGIEALSGPLHGGANEEVIHMLKEIGSAGRVKNWYRKAREEKRKIPGFGHRVYKAYDPRARILGPLAEALSAESPESSRLMETAKAIEELVIGELGEQKKIFPNVDFYSGIVYNALGLPPEMYTPIFAVARVVGWSARILEYLQHNRIFRPRAIYTGEFYDEYPRERL